MGKLNQNFSDCIRQESKLKNGGFVLATMGGGKILCCGMIFFILLLMCVSLFFLPSPYNIILPNAVLFIFKCIVISSVALFGFIIIRVLIIYNKGNPWKNGLEYTIYLLIIAFLFSISGLMVHITIYYYLPIIPRMALYIYIGGLVIITLLAIRLLIKRVRGTQKNKGEQKSLVEYQKAISIGGSIGTVIFLITIMLSTHIELLIMYVLSGLISFVFFGLWPFIIQNIYVFFRYRQDLDLDCCYQKIDGIDPKKNYKGKF